METIDFLTPICYYDAFVLPSGLNWNMNEDQDIIGFYYSIKNKEKLQNDINNLMKKFSNNIKVKDETEFEDEYGFCKYCGWNSCYEDSHIHYGNTRCNYITSKYKLYFNEDGEIEYFDLEK
jgi:hypothetical protein